MGWSRSAHGITNLTFPTMRQLLQHTTVQRQCTAGSHSRRSTRAGVDAVIIDAETIVQAMREQEARVPGALEGRGSRRLASQSHSTRGAGVAEPARRSCPGSDAAPVPVGATRAATRSPRAARGQAVDYETGFPGGED